MNKYIASLLVFCLIFTAPINALGALSEPDRAQLDAENTLTNPGFESSTAAWTAPAGTLTTVSTLGVKDVGNASGAWDSASSGQVLASAYQTVTAGDGFSGKNGVVACDFKCATGTCTHKLEVYDGANLLGSETITSSTTGYEKKAVNFIYPPSGTVRLQIKSVASNEPLLYVDKCTRRLAEGYNLFSATGIIGTEWEPSTHVTVTNMGTITDNQLKERRVADSLEVSGTVQLGAGAGGDAALVLSGLVINAVKAGTGPGNKLGDIFMGASSQLQHYGAGVPQGVIFYDGSTTDRLFMATKTFTDTTKIFDKADGSGIKPSSDSKATIHFTVPIQGWTAQVNGLNFISDQAAASWSGYHNANCTWFTDSTTQIDPPNAASGLCALVQKKNRNFGTVVTTGSVQPGVTFTPLKKGFFMAVASTMLSNTNGPSQAAFSRMVDQNGEVLGTANSYSNSATPTQVPIYGVFEVTDLATPTTLKIQIASTSGSYTSYLGNGTTNAIEWNIFQLDGSQGVPHYAGAMSSKSPGDTVVVSAHVTPASGTVTIDDGDGSWLTGTYLTASYTQLNFNTGVFRADGKVRCVCTAEYAIGSCVFEGGRPTPSGIGIVRNFRTDLNSNGDIPFDIICVGDK